MAYVEIFMSFQIQNLTKVSNIGVFTYPREMLWPQGAMAMPLCAYAHLSELHRGAVIIQRNAQYESGKDIDLSL